jgi:hypothetical protein
MYVFVNISLYIDILYFLIAECVELLLMTTAKDRPPAHRGDVMRSPVFSACSRFSSHSGTGAACGWVWFAGRWDWVSVFWTRRMTSAGTNVLYAKSPATMMRNTAKTRFNTATGMTCAAQAPKGAVSTALNPIAATTGRAMKPAHCVHATGACMNR